MKYTRGFTLLEVVIAVGIMATLFTLVIVAINPKKHFDAARNTERMSHLDAIVDAIHHYGFDNSGRFPAGLDGTLRMIGTAETGCSVVCAPGEEEAGGEGEGEGGGASDLIDDSEADFDRGSYASTEWDAGDGAVRLGSGQLTGSYTSEVKDAVTPVSWTSLAWLSEEPYGKALPDTGESESGYTSGNVDMTGNQLLLHMNESSGSIIDTSGNGNNAGVVYGLTYNAPGIFDTAIEFNGGGQHLSIPYSPTLQLPDAGGAAFIWIRLDENSYFASDRGMGIFRQLNDNAQQARSGYSLEAYRVPGGNVVLRGHISTSWNNSQLLNGTTPLNLGEWYHVGITWTQTTLNLYLNGVLEATAPRTTTLTWNTQLPFLIGSAYASVSTGKIPFRGRMDELAVFSRTLSATEAMDVYRRGATDLKFQVRSCDASDCSDGTFVGPDGTSNSYYDELDNGEESPPSFVIDTLSDAQYFQYRAEFESNATTYSPKLEAVTIGNSGGESGGGEEEGNPLQTAEACLDLSSDLAPTYLQEIPFDPRLGSAEKTQYAVRIDDPLYVHAIACTPADGETLEVVR